MATRALQILDKGLIRPYTVAAGQVVTRGKPVVFAATDNEIQDAPASGENSFAIALEKGEGGQRVKCLLLGSAVVPVKVGTGGATRGLKARAVADGLTDATPGGGTTPLEILGQFLQSGVADDLVGLLVNPSSSVSA